MKLNKTLVIVSSILILLPMLIGLLLWDRLPEQMVTHWNAQGEADGFGSRGAAVVLPYLSLLLAHWVCLWFTAKDPGNQSQSRKAVGILYWILPCVSILIGVTSYRSALGTYTFREGQVLIVIIGLFFILMGNYMPKLRRNRTYGIRLPWTVNNEENWNKTHRLGGKVWVICGAAILLGTLLPETYMVTVLCIALLTAIVIPTACSYLNYKDQIKRGVWMAAVLTRQEKTWRKISIAVTVVILALCGLLMVTGDIEYTFDDTHLIIDADYWSDMAVPYETIEAVEYGENIPAGSRTNGFGSPRLGLGMFYNEPFGNYTRYSYGGSDDCVILTVNSRYLVLTGKDNAATQALYEALLEKVQK